MDFYTFYINAETVWDPYIKNVDMYTIDVLLIEPPSLGKGNNVPPEFIEQLNDWFFKKNDDIN